MKRKHLAIALAVAVVAVGVAVGVHLLNREARADVTYWVFIEETDGQETWPLEGATVEFSYDDVIWDPATYIGGGWYTCTWEDEPYFWLVRIVLPQDARGEDPPENPLRTDGTFTSATWVVSFPPG